MTAALVNRLRDIGIILSFEGGRLRLDSKPGRLTDSIRNLIQSNRLELIAALTPECTAVVSSASEPVSIPAQIDTPAYIKRCVSCSGTNLGPVAGPAVWGCLSCCGLKTIDPSCCPSCGEESLVVERKAGRVCFRSACRFGKSGRRTESYPDSRESISANLMALWPTRPETPDVPSTGPCCPVCTLSVDAPVLCTHLRQLRADAEMFVREERLAKSAKGQRKPLARAERLV